ncbi:hypothetical protein [Companilactobacillus ginsenosidimutans]|uniref:hypothetical protein n=1 Tax=Companilactobacillus ginsenosidimutans TaxID=1007676 RepID=UPI00065FEC54|nr:hypothetical protein [Companilactobacillus ginsenosidimutans]
MKKSAKLSDSVHTLVLITLDPFKNLSSERLLHLDTDIKPECGPGVNIQLSLKDYYGEIQKNLENELKSITLKDIIDSYEKRIEDPKSDYLELIKEK